MDEMDLFFAKTVKIEGKITEFLNSVQQWTMRWIHKSISDHEALKKNPKIDLWSSSSLAQTDGKIELKKQNKKKSTHHTQPMSK